MVHDFAYTMRAYLFSKYLFQWKVEDMIKLELA